LITKDRQYRSFDFEMESQENEMKVKGKPVVFNNTTVIYEFDGVQYKEIIDSKAFDGCDISDVVLNIDHEGKPAAKTKNGTLTLEVKSDGVYMEADLSKNETGRELFEDIQNRFYEAMSFAFTVAEESYDRLTRTRTILKIKKCFDVSAVTFPAYANTSISQRSFFEAEAENERKLVEADLELRKRLLLKTYL